MKRIFCAILIFGIHFPGLMAGAQVTSTFGDLPMNEMSGDYLSPDIFLVATNEQQLVQLPSGYQDPARFLASPARASNLASQLNARGNSTNLAVPGRSSIPNLPTKNSPLSVSSGALYSPSQIPFNQIGKTGYFNYDGMRNAVKPAQASTDEEIPTTQKSLDRFNHPLQTKYLSEVRTSAAFDKTWTSPNFCHQPLYFEDPNLERHGLHHGVFQDGVSAVRFVANTTQLPYKMATNPPRCLTCPLGHPRPGDCAPAIGYGPELSARGGIAQTLVILGISFGL